ncbi:ferredoxin reductase family protein [Lutimaribacter saemankumensis]|uniref:Predicted ferric reductase n=1 Tax=Lutimaribacter saemankumensis TaxID=490829 RepID=A0A1G8GE54_9RHOB|nr:ferredoxin reductase family protein [Lutimaribacter saemankumensis]SDH92649.1 Predicted ferric reductase [Lutimaribacter saemankumensis]
MPDIGTDQGARGARPSPHLPPVAVAGLYLAVCLAPLVLAYLQSVAPMVAWGMAAAGLGLVGLAAMTAQFVTSGRFQIISGGLGIDRVMAFHKTAAWWVFLVALIHPVIYIVPTYIADPALAIERLWAYYTLPHYRSGVIALFALGLLVSVAALHRHLPLPYELWRATHIVLALVATGAGLHHALTVGRFSASASLSGFWWVMGALVAGVVLILYGWRWARLHTRQWRLASVTKVADRLWELDIQPVPGTRPLVYRAGQFVWLTEGTRRFPLFDHPFSIADSPARQGLSLIVKEAGDFTNRIGTLAKGTPIGIDGPYGNFTLKGRGGDAVLLIAGGVGIAPVMGILRDLVARGHSRPVRLAYAAGMPRNFACLDEIGAAASKLDLTTLLLSETDATDWTSEIGLLDRARLSDLLRGLNPKQTVAMICGPGPMVTAVADDLIDLGLPADRIMYERFDYSEGASRLDRRMRRRFLGLAAGLGLGVAAFVAVQA